MAVGVALGVGVAVDVGVGVEVKVAVADGLGVLVAVGVAVDRGSAGQLTFVFQRAALKVAPATSSAIDESPKAVAWDGSGAFQARMYTDVLFSGPALSYVKVLNGRYPRFRAGGGRGAPLWIVFVSSTRSSPPAEPSGLGGSMRPLAPAQIN